MTSQKLQRCVNAKQPRRPVVAAVAGLRRGGRMTARSRELRRVRARAARVNVSAPRRNNLVISPQSTRRTRMSRNKFRRVETRSRPRSLAATLAALPSMSLFPSAPLRRFTQIRYLGFRHSFGIRTSRRCIRLSDIRGLRHFVNAGRTLPRAQLRWCCLPHARWRCSYPVEGLR